MPSEFFSDHPTQDPWLVCNTQEPREFLMETLEYFGLPTGYLKKEGHWKNWLKIVQEVKKGLRKQMKPNIS